jgi:thiol-disulfide isomerase/thioredoxin
MKDIKGIERKNNKSTKKGLFIFITLITMLFGGYLYLDSNKENKHQNLNREFTFKTSKDKTFHIKAYPNHLIIDELKGKIIFLKVFGWDCEYCQKEIPELIKLKSRFSDAFDAISIEYQHHQKAKNLELIDKYGINYHIIEGDKNIEFLDYLKNEYGWNGVIPLTVVIGTDGKILAFEVGYKSYSLTTLLQTTLKDITTEATFKEEQK